MKKNLSVLIVVMMGLGLLLSACGGGGTPDPKAIIGTWSDSSASMSFSADGKYSVEGVEVGTYTFSGDALTITLVDGTVQKFTAEVDGSTLSLKDESGSNYKLTKK